MSAEEPSLTERDGVVRFEVHVKPRASRSAVLAWKAGALGVAVTAPPVEGAANAEVVEVLARALGVPKRSIVIARGEASRTKLVEVSGLPLEAVGALLTAAR